MAIPFLGNLMGGGLLKRAIPQPSGVATQVGFAKTLGRADFAGIATADQALVSTQYNVFGTFTVPAQQLYHYGAGSEATPDNQGYVFVNAVSNAAGAALLEGTYRLRQANAQQTNILTVIEKRSEELRAGQTASNNTTDRRLLTALPEQTQFDWVGEDSLLQLAMKSDTASISMAYGSSLLIRIPVTIQQ